GFKTSAQLTIVGFDAVAKARRTGEAILERVGELLQQQGLGPFSATHLEVLGAESPYGPHAQPAAAQMREAILRLTARHPAKAALELLAREIAPSGTSFAPGTTGAGGRASVSPLIRQYAFLLDKARIAPQVTLDGAAVSVPNQPPAPVEQAPEAIESIVIQEAYALPAGVESVEVPLLRLAWARSGDKGDASNIGVIARKPEWLPLLRAQLTEARVKDWLAHLVQGPVTRYEVPGIHAFNFVCQQALGGGGMASLRNDALGKGMGQILLAMPVRVPMSWVN
ncbi:MAG TPA: terpene utilization protein AtuA, partial [Ottowia sp.]|nr:terpene utilization protein AtuA [Ottowia sp.]